MPPTKGLRVTGIVRRAAVAAVLLAAPIGLGGGQASAAGASVASTVTARGELRSLAAPPGRATPPGRTSAPGLLGGAAAGAPLGGAVADPPPLSAAAAAPRVESKPPAAAKPAPTKSAPTKPASKKSTPPKPARPAAKKSTPAKRASTKPPAATGPSIGSSSGFSAVESQVIALTNAARAAHGCAPLRADSRLGAAARAHSADMAAHGYFSHVSPNGATFRSRAAAAGYSAAMGENIAWGWPTATVVMEQWMNSPPHRANIENCAAVAVGVGVAYRADGTPFWTQEFGRV